MGRIPEEIIRGVVDRCDIVEIISSYIPLKKAGRNFKAICPFHNEKTASFVVNPVKQIFHCFGCGVGGDVISFVMRHERVDFIEAVRILAREVNVDIPEDVSASKVNIRQAILKLNELSADYFYKQLLSSKSNSARQARQYLKDRGIVIDTVKQFRLGFALDEWDGLLRYLKGKDISLSLMEKAGLIISKSNGGGFYDRFRNRIIFPIFDTRDRCCAFGGRIVESDNSLKDNNRLAKYINSPETEVYVKGRHLYGLNLAKHEIASKGYVVVVEGYLDCIMPFQAGFHNIVAALGTALTIEQIRLIKRYTNNIVLLFDMDQAGESAMMRSIDMLIEEGVNVKIAVLDKGDDPDSFIRRLGIDSFCQRVASAKPVFDYKLDTLKQRYGVDSVEARARVAEDMFPTIAKFGNAVKVSGYIGKLAREINTPEDALIVEFKKYVDRNTKQGYNYSNKRGEEWLSTKGASLIRAVERNILSMLFEDDRILERIRKDIAVYEFQDSRARKIVEKVYEFRDNGKKVDALTIMNCFVDEEIKRIIAELAVFSEQMCGDREKMYQDCVSRIKTDAVKAERKRVLDQIREAERTGEYDRLRDLKERFLKMVRP